MKSQIKILLVEDEVITAKFIKSQLEKVGYKVPLHVTTGEKAVASIEKNIPDIILMDIRLAGEIDGIEAAGIIQKMIKDLPVIFLTGYDDMRYKERADKLKPLGYLIKPASINELKMIIDSYYSQ